MSVKGYMAGFVSKALRFSDVSKERRLAHPGPADYDPKLMKKRDMKIQYKPRGNLSFNEKNPLNFVRPITVNVYFQNESPGPGQYSNTK